MTRVVAAPTRNGVHQGEVAMRVVNILLFPFAVCFSENDSGHKSQDGPDSRGEPPGRSCTEGCCNHFLFPFVFYVIMNVCFLLYYKTLFLTFSGTILIFFIILYEWDRLYEKTQNSFTMLL